MIERERVDVAVGRSQMPSELLVSVVSADTDGELQRQECIGVLRVHSRQ